jgi:ribonuclease D
MRYISQGYSQRLSKKGGRTQAWTEKNIFVFKRLYSWRVEQAQARDESSSYICPSSLLLNAAEYLPTTAEALLKLSSPLPASMRPQAQSEVEPGSAEAVSPVDLVAAVKQALDAWDAENPAVTVEAAAASTDESKLTGSHAQEHNTVESEQSPTIATPLGSNIVLTCVIIAVTVGVIGICARIFNRKR